LTIRIKKMSLGGHSVPVPIGLSELVNRAGAWTSESVPPLSTYRREVKKIAGRLVTELTYVGDVS